MIDKSRGIGFLERACPVRTAIDVIAGRWKPSILENINEGPRRFSELITAVEGISPQALSVQLRQLMADDVITKTEDDPAQYRLTARGEALAEVMDGLARWGVEYLAWRGSPGAA